MSPTADLSSQSQPVPHPAQVLYISLELSPSKWLVTSLLSGTDRMSKHLVTGGDGSVLLRLLAGLRGGCHNSLARRPATRKRQAAWSRDWTMKPWRS